MLQSCLSYLTKLSYLANSVPLGQPVSDINLLHSKNILKFFISGNDFSPKKIIFLRNRKLRYLASLGALTIHFQLLFQFIWINRFMPIIRSFDTAVSLSLVTTLKTFHRVRSFSFRIFPIKKPPTPHNHTHTHTSIYFILNVARACVGDRGNQQTDRQTEAWTTDTLSGCNSCYS